MKKWIATYIVMLSMIMVMTVPALAKDVYTEGTLYYTVKDESITITGCFSHDETVTVPNVIAGVPVNTIAKNAFSGNAYVKTVNLPDTITTVEDGAFSGGVKVNWNSNVSGEGQGSGSSGDKGQTSGSSGDKNQGSGSTDDKNQTSSNQGTTTNKDGSTTTTVTNKDGSKTETTKKKDGTTVAVTKKKDGTVVTVTTQKDGSYTSVTERTDGTKSIVTADASGNEVVEEVDADGNVITAESADEVQIDEADVDLDDLESDEDEGGIKSNKIVFGVLALVLFAGCAAIGVVLVKKKKA